MKKNLSTKPTPKKNSKGRMISKLDKSTKTPSTFLSSCKKNTRTLKKRLIAKAKAHKVTISIVAVFVFIGLLSVAIATSNGDAQIESEQPVRALNVNAFSFGETSIQEDTVGVIKNTTSLTLVAQSNGPVQSVLVAEGDQVNRGRSLIQQESAYAAGNAQAVQAQLARKNLEIAETSLESTVRQVSLSREQADLSQENAELLRDISKRSIHETKELIELTEEIIQKIEHDIEAEKAGSNDASTIQGLRQQLVTYKGSVNQARSSLRSLEYQTDSDKPQAKLADIQKKLAYETTELQLRTSKLQKEVAQLNVRQAAIAEAATRVSAPITGRVEKVFVQPGQFVSAGTPVAVIRGETALILEIFVAGRVALQINPEEPLLVFGLGHQETGLSLPIQHVSSAPVSGQLYQVLAEVPAQYERFIFENQTVSVSLPLYETSVGGGHSFVPLDALFVSSTGRYVFVERDGLAIRVDVETGQIVGTGIEILTGLQPGDIVILDRRVIDRQPVKVELIETPTTSSIELG